MAMRAGDLRASLWRHLEVRAGKNLPFRARSKPVRKLELLLSVFGPSGLLQGLSQQVVTREIVRVHFERVSQHALGVGEVPGLQVDFAQDYVGPAEERIQPD